MEDKIETELDMQPPWKSPESAPKDGTKILAAIYDAGFIDYEVISFVVDFWRDVGFEKIENENAKIVGWINIPQFKI